jgi:hypothetical protein
MPWDGIEPAIPATKRPQTHILDREDTGISDTVYIPNIKASVRHARLY